MDLALEGKVALVTGGSDGIGKAAAISMAREGARITICARRPDVLEETASEIREATGVEVLSWPTDVTKLKELDSLFEKVNASFGRIDILVNNAGTAAAGSFSDQNDDTWQADKDLKLFAAKRCSRMVIPTMKAQGGGRIINITTIGGKAPGAASVPTSVTRAAGIALTKAMSKEYAKDNILVNTVCIGLIKAGQHKATWEHLRTKGYDLTLEQWYAKQAEGIPLDRYGEPDEAGAVIAFLATERASYITGASINLDGGMSSVV